MGKKYFAKERFLIDELKKKVRKIKEQLESEKNNLEKKESNRT